ncbi:hypothetical protein NE237_017447 [Protea cynaroides]|uniref:HTH La-type RNA-binding domain-containing protein n=1 Tax=Protea cynaroides TaxID=273540 RepID=A0A9Q0K825_9MAGN|nr:hypothetical protein NE237_017447 [Protea cynaroides]
MADQSCSSNPWSKSSEPVMDSAVDSSSWSALYQRVPSSEMIPASSCLPVSSTCVESEIGDSISTKITAKNDIDCFSTINSPVSASICVSVYDSGIGLESISLSSSSPSPMSRGTGSESISSTSSSPTLMSRGTGSESISSSSSSYTPMTRVTRPIQSESSRGHSYGYKQNHHQHYSSGRLPPNQRGDGLNAKGGDGFPNQNFSNRRHQQQRGVNNWNHRRGGFNGNHNSRFVNLQQHSHHGFVIAPPQNFGPPPFPHPFPHSTPMINPPYVNVNVNFPPPPSPDLIPGYMLPYDYYNNAYFSVPPVPPLPPIPSLPPYVDALCGGALTYDQPNLPNPEVELCNRIRHQIEYYFSKENLVKDAYLKSLMDDEGWVPLHLIAEFRRVKAMTNDLNLIVRALQPSAFLEVQLINPMASAMDRCRTFMSSISSIEKERDEAVGLYEAQVLEVTRMSDDLQTIKATAEAEKKKAKEEKKRAEDAIAAKASLEEENSELKKVKDESDRKFAELELKLCEVEGIIRGRIYK